MSYSKCVTSLGLNGKIPARELKDTAAEYQAEGMPAEAALLRAVEEKLELMVMEERKIIKAVRSAYEADGGKKKPAKPKKEKPAPEKVPELALPEVGDEVPVEEAAKFSIAGDPEISTTVSAEPIKRSADDQFMLDFATPPGPNDTTIRATIDGEEVGYLDLSVAADGKTAAVREIFVNPEQRRKGVATKLMDAARAQGFEVAQSEHQTEAGKAFRKAYDGPKFSIADDSAAGAINDLMAAKSGETVITRPGVGDITIAYGDEKSGLAHIAKRRGASFMDRLPGLLRDGDIYRKADQPGRIFIGNARDEAVIRLDWDGQTKNWLLSAYEKYPDLKASTSAAPAAAPTAKKIKAKPARPAKQFTKENLREAITKGVLGQVIASMIDAGTIVLHDGPATLPNKIGKNAQGVQAVTLPDGTIHMVANSLTERNALPVMLHEAFHQGAEKLIGTKQWSELMGRAASLYRQSEMSSGKARAFFDKARERVGTAKAKGSVPSRMEVEEFMAYAIEEYESAPASVRKWIDDLIGLVKAWMVARFGKQLGAVTPAQLSALAKVAIMDAAYQRRGEIFGPLGEVFSVGGERTIEVDGVRRPILDSEGRLIAVDFEGQLEFWRQYDGPVDEKGRPIIDAPRYSIAADTDVAEDSDEMEESDGLTPPPQGLLRRLQSQFQDNMNRLKQVQERIAEVSGNPDLGNSDYYGAETNRPGRSAARLEDARDQLTGPLMKRLAKSGFKPTQLSELLHAMHAKERNDKLGLLHPEDSKFYKAISDHSVVGASGMATAKAAEILKQYEGETELHELATQARAIARATLDLKLEYGLITAKDHEQLAKAYENYVPLKGDGEFGPKIKRAMGHDAREELILDNIARDYDQAVTVGEKNLARQSLLRMVLQFPDPKLWTVGMPAKGRYVAGKVYNIVHRGETVGSYTSRSQVDAFLEAKGDKASQYEVLDSNGERVAEFIKPLQDNEIMVYLKGAPIRIQIYDEALAAQLRPLNGQQLHPILEFMRGVNRYLSKIYTGYNPAFILRNMARDAMTGTINMMGNQGTVTAATAWAKYPAAFATMGKWAATKKIPAGPTGAYLNEYRQHGGKVGASWLSDLEEQGKTLQRMYDDAYGVSGYTAEGRVDKAALIAGRKIVGGMAHVVEVANQAAENALRLSLFITLREQGMSVGKAAQAAKGVTVDFDRKGTSTAALGAIYLFFNPAVQGTANAMKTLVKGNNRKQAWGALGAMASLGFFAAATGMDDDKDRWLGEGWEVRARNFMLNAGGKQIRVPLSQEFAPFYAMGAAMAEASRGESKIMSAAHVVSSFIDAYFPLDVLKVESDNHATDLGMGVMPTVIKPFMESAINRNSFGSQIVPESPLTVDRADNLKMNRNTKNTAYDRTAQNIAAAGVGLGLSGQYENDITKVSPETLKHFWRTYTGGLGQFVGDVGGLGMMLADDPGQTQTSDYPFVKDFVKTNDVKAIRGRYYDLAKDARKAITEFEQAKKAGDGDAMERIANNDAKAKLVGLGRMVRMTTKAAAALRDEEVDINASPDLTGAQKREKLKELEAQEEELYRSAIDAFK